MRIMSVLHLQGLLLLFLGAALLVPIPVALIDGDGTAAAFLATAALSAALGYGITRTTRLQNDLRAREGFAVVTLGWLGYSLVGCLPFLFTGAIPGFTDAFFETISGFTTTGATILSDIEALPRSVLFWRCFTHWIGGMGMIVLSLAILPFLGIGGMQLFQAESTGPVADKLTPRIRETARLLWYVYALISAVELMLLLLGGMSLFDALCHTFSTMGTGGFSPLSRSIGAYDSAYIDIVITVFMLIAGASFALHYRFLRGDWTVHWRNVEFRWYMGFVAVACLLIGADTLARYAEPARAVRDTLFQVSSIITTTGFVTADYEQWAPSSQLVLLALMFVGGCAGSTGGGMKVARVIVVLKLILNEITRLIHPNALLPVRLGDQVVPREVITNVLSFFALFVLVFAGGVLMMTALGLDIVSAIGAVAATLGNIGPGLGATGPTDHFGALPAAGKWLLAGLMLLGRLELYTVVVLLSPAYWRK